ncbi:hypothetical protein [Rugamonas sp. DEMB1]|uniref:hypothetical protein n=1 Tax=Rugamonas sp. DEMB1 TaxID=3039386 RepID=UPI002449A9ED|nr:hypothetical protein [Rugamonas sp. DEMB1]WGG53060.1 hypothetical protein QC826_13655 [Rugamonas sp. DEMB1]
MPNLSRCGSLTRWARTITPTWPSFKVANQAVCTEPSANAGSASLYQVDRSRFQATQLRANLAGEVDTDEVRDIGLSRNNEANIIDAVTRLFQRGDDGPGSHCARAVVIHPILIVAGEPNRFQLEPVRMIGLG